MLMDAPEFELEGGFSVRLPREDDAPLLAQVVDENRAYLREWMPWLDVSQSPTDSLAFIQRVLTDWTLKKLYTGVIIKNSDIAGTLGFHNHIHRHVAIGYWVSAKYAKQGVATIASKALINWAFNFDDELHLIELRAATGNCRSRRIAEKLKMKHEGVLRDREWLYDHFVDHEVYSITREEWKTADYATIAQKKSIGF